MSYDPMRSTVPGDGDDPLWDEGDDASYEAYEYYASDTDPEALYYEYLLENEEPAFYYAPASQSIYDVLDEQIYEAAAGYEEEEKALDEAQGWTRRRVLLLLIALAIIASLVLYLLIPALEVLMNPPPAPPLAPPDLL